MAHEVVLLCCDPEATDYSSPVRVLTELVRKHSPTVHASLSKSAVKIVRKAYKSAHFPVVLDHEWDVQMTELSIFNQYLLHNDELTSFADELGSHFSHVNFELFETQENFHTRLHKALFAASTGMKVAVVSQEVINGCFTFMHIDQGDCTPILMHLRVWPTTEKVTVVGFNDTWDEALEEVNKTSFLSEVQLTTSMEMPSLQPAANLSLSHSTRKDTSKFEKTLEDQVSSLSSDFARQVKKVVTQVVEECRPRGPDPSEAVVVNLTESLNMQHSRIMSDLRRVGEQLNVGDNFEEKQRSEVEALLQASTRVQQQAREVESLLAQLAAETQPRIDTLQAQLADLEKQQREFQLELEEARMEKLTKGFPLAVKSVECAEDSCFFAKILNRKFYDVYGYVVVSQGNQAVTPEMYITFQRDSRVNLGTLSNLAPGKYEVTLLHFYDKHELSRPFEFTKLPRSYEKCMVYESIDNREEVEQAFKALGRGGVELFRSLAAGWRNEDRARIDQFLGLLLDENLHSEADLRARLQEQNFIVET